jgi:phosphatidylglycerophosphate synthase
MAARKPPTIAEVRTGGQPPGLTDRRNEEHWAGRLYMRSVSPYFSWLFIRIGFAPNHLTALMVACGVLGGVAVALPLSPPGPPGLPWLIGAVAGALLVQAYLLLDCSDGEVARFTGKTSITGIYLDRIGHYMSEVALLVGLGYRAEGALQSGGWVELGLVGALGAALIKAETDNVVVARAKSGVPVQAVGGDRALRPRSTPLALARQAASLLRFHRIIGAVELSLLIVAAAVIDHVRGGLTATRWLVVAVAVVAAVQTLLHLISILASRRLR